MCPTSRSPWSYAAAFPRLLLRDRLLAVLTVLLLALALHGHVSPRLLAVHARPRVLLLLASLMAASNALLASGYPSLLLVKLLGRGVSVRVAALVLALTAGLLAALLTNDASLFLTMPTAMLLAKWAGGSVDPALIAALTAAGANIGSALTPIGNPQNMLIASVYHTGFTRFTLAMLPLTALGYAAIALVALLLAPPERIALQPPPPSTRPRSLAAGLAGLSLVLWGVETGHTLPAALLAMLATAALDPGSLAGISPRLLAVVGLFFVDFWLLSLELEPLVGRAASSPIATYLYAVILSQAVSNVPAAAMLAGRTRYWQALAYGVNAGGVLLLWSSLANLIGLRLAGGIDVKRYQAYTLAVGLAVALPAGVLVVHST